MKGMTRAHRVAGLLFLVGLLGCDDSLFGLSKAVEVSIYEPELTVIEERERVTLSMTVGITNENPYAVGFSSCEVELQERQSNVWEPVAGMTCPSYNLSWVEPGSGTSAPWWAGQSFSEGWAPTTSSEYRVVARVRAPDNEGHSVFSAPFVLDPTFQ